MPDTLRPHELQPPRLLSPWDFPGKDTEVGCHFLFQGIFSTLGSNQGVSCTEGRFFTNWAILLLTTTITTNCGNFLKIWECQFILPASWETCKRVKKQQLELDMKQPTGSKLGKEYLKATYYHPACLTYMQSTSWKCQTRWSSCWNQDCWKKHQ